MAVLLWDNFENANLNKWSVHGLTPTIVTSPVHAGSYAVGLTARVDPVNGSDMLNQVVAESPDAVLDTWVMFTAMPDDTYHEFAMLWTSDYVERVIAGVQRWGTEIWWFLAGPYDPPTAVHPGTINLNQWYHVQIRRKVGVAGQSAIELWVDDVRLVNDTSRTITGNTGVVAIGGWTSKDGVTEVFDDFSAYTVDIVVPDGYLTVNATFDGVAVGASVSANGSSGTTPVTFTLAPASYTVNAIYQGGSQTKSATVASGQTTVVDFAFTSTPPPPPPPNLLIPAAIAFGVVSVVLIATRKKK